MPLSSNAVIHLTEDKSSLLGILADNFKLAYCKESIKLSSKKSLKFHVPMVSFCDIPLSQIKNHIKQYGPYGIGLTKEWAIKNGLNPVIYMEKESTLSKGYAELIKDIFKKPESNTAKATEMQKQFADIFRYMKNYQDDLARKGKTYKDYRFSDEREWRYVPEYSSKCRMIVSTEEYALKMDEINSKLSSMRLKFCPDDIRYIFIHDENEILEIARHLRDVKGAKYTDHQVTKALTRILTTRQIQSDI